MDLEFVPFCSVFSNASRILKVARAAKKWKDGGDGWNWRDSLQTNRLTALHLRFSPSHTHTFPPLPACSAFGIQSVPKMPCRRQCLMSHRSYSSSQPRQMSPTVTSHIQSQTDRNESMYVQYRYVPSDLSTSWVAPPSSTSCH